MEADGSQQTSLTTEASGLLYYEPRWSPDGQSIAFVADYDNYELYVMKSDGSEFRQLTSEYGLGSVSDWSPDSQQFVLVGRDDRPIYVLDVATATLTNIMSQAGYYGDPVWSPDGQSIAFVGYLVSDDDAGGGEIYSMHSDGSGLVNLTHNPSRDYGPAWQP